MIKRDGPILARCMVAGCPLLTVSEHSLPVTRFMIAWRGGAVSDPRGLAGLSRMQLQMILRGTGAHDRSSFNIEIERLGSTLHGMTGVETALLRASALERHLSATFDLAAEALCTASFADAELDQLRSEIIDSLDASREDDESVAEIFLRRALYRDHLLSRSPQGEPHDLAQIDSRRVRVHHRNRLSADDLIFAFAGDIEAEACSDKIAALLAALPYEPATDAVLRLSDLSPPPTNRGLSITVVDKPDREQVQMRVIHPGLAGSHPDALALWLGVMAFGGTFTSPFSHAVREQRGWSYVAQADFDWRGRLPSPLVLRTAPATEDALDCLALEIDLFDQFATGQLDGSSLELARSYALNRYPFELATPATMLSRAIAHELLGWDPEILFGIPAMIQQIDHDRVLEVVRRHMCSDNLVVVMVATAHAIMPRLSERFPTASIEVVDYRSQHIVA